MATANPFDILGDDDSDDPSSLIAKQELKNLNKKTQAAATPAAPAAASKFPSKPAPPQAAKDARSATARGSSTRGGFRGGRGTRDFRSDNPNGFSSEETFTNERVTRQQNFRGPRNEEGGFNERVPRQNYGSRNEEGGAYERAPRQQNFQEGGANERAPRQQYERAPRRTYERHSGTGRGFEVKRDGSGKGNWGSNSEETPVQESEEMMKNEEKEKAIEGEGAPLSEEQKDNSNKEEVKEEEPEDKEMTLEEYEKVREEKRKSLLTSAAVKTEFRKVEVDKDLQSMQLLSSKKTSDPIFIKLGAEKDSKKKDAEKEERAKKALSINEFLKPAEGERGGYGGRRGGRGRGLMRGGYSSGSRVQVVAPAIEDPSQFPTLGAK